MTRLSVMLEQRSDKLLSPTDLAWLAAYGAGVARALERGCHGQLRRVVRDGAVVEETIDASAEAVAWGEVCGDVAAGGGR